MDKYPLGVNAVSTENIPSTDKVKALLSLVSHSLKNVVTSSEQLMLLLDITVLVEPLPKRITKICRGSHQVRFENEYLLNN